MVYDPRTMQCASKLKTTTVSTRIFARERQFCLVMREEKQCAGSSCCSVPFCECCFHHDVYDLDCSCLKSIIATATKGRKGSERNVVAREESTVPCALHCSWAS